MASYLRIPESNIAGAIGTAIAKINGVVVSVGNKSLDAVEIALEKAKQSNAITKSQVRAIRESAETAAANKMSEAITSVSTGGALNDFLNNVGLNGTSATNVAKTALQATKLRAEASKILDQAESQISKLVSNNNKLSRQTIRSVDTTLKAVEASLTAILTAVKTLRAIIITLKAPIAALKVTILVIKALPLPQRYLIVSFTILESDLLEMMTELVTQADEQVDAIEAILKSIEDSLQPILDRIKRIRASLALLEVEALMAEASVEDLDVLDRAGLYDKSTGESLFDRIQEANQQGLNSITYGKFDVDLTNAAIGNQVQLAGEGDYIILPRITSGSFIEDWYKWWVGQPDYPKKDPAEEGWSRYPEDKNARLREPDEQLWRLSLLVNSKGSVFGGYDRPLYPLTDKEAQDLFNDLKKYRTGSGQTGSAKTDPGYGLPLTYSGSFQNTDRSGLDNTGWLSSDLSGSFVEDDSRKVIILGEGNFDQKPGILKSDNWEQMEIAALDKLRDLPLSKDLQDHLVALWDVRTSKEAGTADMQNDAVAYLAANGETYYLRVIEDSNSPKVAVRRYVNVQDASGTTIIDGIKTFSTNKESLIEEMKLQLDQLTR